MSRGAHAKGRTTGRAAPALSRPKDRARTVEPGRPKKAARPKPSPRPKAARPKAARPKAARPTTAGAKRPSATGRVAGAAARTSAAARRGAAAATRTSATVPDGDRAPTAMERLRAIGPGGPGSSADGRRRKLSERRPRDPAERRRRIPLAIAAGCAVVILATSFPLAGLLSQHRQLSAAAAQLDQLQRANRALAQQEHLLSSKSAIQRLARERYQLVSPGQTLYDVLPPGGHGGKPTAGAPVSGDPGNQAPVAPADAPDLSPDPNLAPAQTPGGTSSASTAHGNGAPGGPGRQAAPTSFWSRVADSLEFWR